MKRAEREDVFIVENHPLEYLKMLTANISLYVAVPQASQDTTRSDFLVTQPEMAMNHDCLGLGGWPAEWPPSAGPPNTSRREHINQVALRLRHIGDELDRDVTLGTRFWRSLQDHIFGEKMLILVQLLTVLCLEPHQRRLFAPRDGARPRPPQRRRRDTV